MREIFAALALAITANMPVLAQDGITRIASDFKIEQSYENAKFYSPNNLLTISKTEFVSQNPVNVVIHMHGCGGLNSDESSWARHLKSNGFFVITPDSFSIPGRPQNCDPKNHVKNLGNDFVYKIRVAEFLYASDQVKKIPSVKNIFIMGHSEGGGIITVAPMRRFGGVISIGSFCNNVVIVDKNVPLLTINHKSDPYFSNAEPYACVEKTAYRAENTTNVVLDETGHEASMNEIAKAAVLDFLRRHTK